MTRPHPAARPAVPHFSSGPCAKRPGWSLDALREATLARSHRSPPARAKLQAVIDRSRALLGIPDDYLIAIVPGSDTGAYEMALWSLLGARPATALVWEAFSKDWATDLTRELRLEDARVIEAPYGHLPDLAAAADPERDLMFVWNGTTSGVRVPDGRWIPAERHGLTLCDATSAAFAMDLPWDRLDVTTWSWQKVLGGEAQHGMLVLSPRAVERLRTHTPPWPIPKLFRMAKDGAVSLDLFAAATINTPSLLAVEDHLDALAWADGIGGLPALIARSEANLRMVADWVQMRDWVEFLAADPATRSCTSICLRFTGPDIAPLDAKGQEAHAKTVAALIEGAGVAYDIGHYRAAPPGLRLWGGATVEAADTAALTQWIDWAHGEALERGARAA